MPESEGGFLLDSTWPRSLPTQVALEIPSQAGVEDSQSVIRRQILSYSAIERPVTHDNNRAVRGYPDRDRTISPIWPYGQELSLQDESSSRKPANLHFEANLKAEARELDIHRRQVERQGKTEQNHTPAETWTEAPSYDLNVTATPGQNSNESEYC